MQILGLLGMYFDAAVVFVTNSSLLFRFAMAILWQARNKLTMVQDPLNAPVQDQFQLLLQGL